MSCITITNLPRTACVSSTLVKLTIQVRTFDDCLYLLDGRLNNLRTLTIDIDYIDIPLSNIENTVRQRNVCHHWCLFVFSQFCRN